MSGSSVIPDQEIYADSAFKRTYEGDFRGYSVRWTKHLCGRVRHEKLRSQVGLVFQYPEHQLFEVDVISDVCFGPKNQGLSEEESEKMRGKLWN